MSVKWTTRAAINGTQSTNTTAQTFCLTRSCSHHVRAVGTMLYYSESLEKVSRNFRNALRKGTFSHWQIPAILCYTGVGATYDLFSVCDSPRGFRCFHHASCAVVSFPGSGGRATQRILRRGWSLALFHRCTWRCVDVWDRRS